LGSPFENGGVPSAVDHVLLDADGVLQHLEGGWVARLAPYLGDRAQAFLEAAWSDEHAALRGEEDGVEQLARHLDAHGCTAPVAEVYPAVWHSIDVVPESIALVRRLQEAGYGVHLGTNQQHHRAAYMREELGYDALFATSVYSCEIGHAKPEPAYFTRAAELIGVAPERIVFVDDRAENVAGARAAGLVAEQWELDLDRADRGLGVLEELLAGHGISLDG
jgi:putative hydrolase of the HAD superfamily